jgi:hypothetical protein
MTSFLFLRVESEPQTQFSCFNNQEGWRSMTYLFRVNIIDFNEKNQFLYLGCAPRLHFVFSLDLNYFRFILFVLVFLWCAAIRSICFFLGSPWSARAGLRPNSSSSSCGWCCFKIGFSFPFPTQILSFRAQNLLPPGLLWFGSHGRPFSSIGKVRR